jgi:hypothetical protein
VYKQNYDIQPAFDEIAAQRNYFLEWLAVNAYASAGRRIPMACFIAMAGTDREAEEVARRGAGWVVDTWRIRPRRWRLAVKFGLST